MTQDGSILTLVRNYPELYDKPHNHLKAEPPRKSEHSHLITKCTTSFLKGKCEDGHEFLKALMCGKEWCEECGKKDSAIHERRIARWWDKVFSITKFGYLIVTVPEELREEFKSRKVLSEFRTYVKRKLQRMGYNKGLVRYHWAGDCKFCFGGKIKNCEVCNGTGADRIFKPHLNIIIEEGYLDLRKGEIADTKKNEKWKPFKEDIARWFNNKFKEALAGKKVKGNFFYSYVKPGAEFNGLRVHKLKYITRATWRIYNKEVCDLLKGYRTSSTWGKWEKSKVENTSDLVTLEKGNCPCCLKDDGVINKITWKKDFMRREIFNLIKTTPLEGGYFFVNYNTS